MPHNLAIFEVRNYDSWFNVPVAVILRIRDIVRKRIGKTIKTINAYDTPNTCVDRLPLLVVDRF